MGLISLFFLVYVDYVNITFSKIIAAIYIGQNTPKYTKHSNYWQRQRNSAWRHYAGP